MSCWPPVEAAGADARIRRADAGGDPASRDLSGHRPGHLADNKAYFLTLTRAFLDGMPASDWPGGNPAADVRHELLETGRAGRPAEEQVRGPVAVISALVAGWILLEDQLLDIVGLPPHDESSARDPPRRVCARLEPLVRRRMDNEVGAGLG